VLLIFILTNVVRDSRWPILLSLIFPIYYMVVSWAITLRLRTRRA
jgi:hypothetical protein